jgi:hypothetical protein
VRVRALRSRVAAAMKGLVCVALGDPTNAPGTPGAALELRELPTPNCGDKDVIIKARSVLC